MLCFAELDNASALPAIAMAPPKVDCPPQLFLGVWFGEIYYKPH
jgi:hypothetical protein